MPTSHGADGDERHEERLLLWVARRTGALDALTSSAGTAAALSRETALDEATAGKLLRALADYGFVRRVGDEYEVTNRALGFLATRDVRSIGALPRALDVVDAAVGFAATDATDDADADASGSEEGTDAGESDNGERDTAAVDGPDDARLRHRLGAHAATPTATVRAGVTAAVHAAPSATRVLDVYGASGVYAVEFAARGYETTFLDTPAVVEAVGPLLAARDVATVPDERRAGEHSVFERPEEDVDLAVAADVLSRHEPADCRRVLAAMREAVDPGGTVVVVGPDRESPTGRRIAVERLCLGSGDAYDAECVVGWVADAGLADVERRSVPGTDYRIVVGRRPERAVDNGPDPRR